VHQPQHGCQYLTRLVAGKATTPNEAGVHQPTARLSVLNTVSGREGYNTKRGRDAPANSKVSGRSIATTTFEM
jgi:hypothetical protein